MRGINGNTPILDRIIAKESKRSNQNKNKNIKYKIHPPFNQNNFFRCHSIKVLPLVILIVLDPHRFTFALRENKSYLECIVFGIDASVIAERQRPIYSRIGNGPPQVDDLEAALKEF